METEETREIMETYGDAFKYKKDRERLEETKETRAGNHWRYVQVQLEIV